MTQKPPVGTLLLCLVVVAASFLPWGTIGFEQAVDGEPGLGEMWKSLAKGFGAGAIEVNAWNSHVSAGSLRIPTWVVPVLAGFVALSLLLRMTAVWSPPRVLCPLLVAVAAAVAAWMTIVLGSSKEGTIGIGALATLVALSALLVAVLRDAPPSPAPAA
jgi:hypothetical protein